MGTKRTASVGHDLVQIFVGAFLVVTMLFWLPNAVAGGVGGLCGNGIVDSNEDCDDGNLFDGDCCSSSCRDEESFRGSEGTALCDQGTRCTDGIDNDGDGLVDAYDPECATLFAFQDWAVLGTGNRGRAVHQGHGVRVQHVDGSVPGFPTAGACVGGVCECPSASPDCQPAGRACSDDDDCGVYPYPLGPSVAGVCSSEKTVVVPESIIDGPLAVEASRENLMRFGDGDDVVVGGGYEVNFALGRMETNGPPPMVGYGVCANGQNTCIRETNPGDIPCESPDWCCQPGDTCEGLRTLVDPTNDFVDRAATGPRYLSCQTARGTLATLADQLAALTPTSSSGRVRVVRRDPPLNISLSGGGNHIVSIDALRLGTAAELIIDGPEDACVLLQVDGSFSAGRYARVSLSGGIKPSNVAWAIRSGGRARLASDIVMAGTLISADGQIQVSKNAQFDGAAFAGKVKTISKDQASVYNHQPFQCLLPTKLSISKSADQQLAIAGTAFVGGFSFAAPLTYTIDVANAGPSWAPGVVVTDVLDSDTALIRATAMSVPDGVPMGICDENPVGTVKCHLGTIAPNEGAQITLSVDTDPSTRGSITNSASVTANVDDDNDPSPGQENSVIETIGIIARSDVTVTNAVGSPAVSPPGPPAVGGRDTVTFVFDVANNGPSDATGVIFVNDVPTGLTYANASASPQGSCAIGGSGNVICNLGTLVPIGDASGNSTAQVAIEAMVDCDAPVTINSTGTASSAELDLANSNNSTAQTLIDVSPCPD